MKKLILTLILVFSFTMKCFAVANIQIDNVDKKTVVDYIISVVSQGNQNFVLDSVNDYGVSFIASKSLNNVLGSQVATQQSKINFTTVQQGENVLLTVNEVATIYHNNGRMEVHPINNVLMQKRILSGIKRYFNDYYLFGYVITDQKKDGGYVIDNVWEGSAFWEKGIRTGDIMIAINDQKVRKNKEVYLSSNMTNEFVCVPVKFLIKQNGVERVVTVTPKLTKAKYKG